MKIGGGERDAKKRMRIVERREREGEKRMRTGEENRKAGKGVRIQESRERLRKG